MKKNKSSGKNLGHQAEAGISKAVSQAGVFHAFIEDLRLFCKRHDMVLIHRDDGISVAKTRDFRHPLGKVMYVYAARVGYSLCSPARSTTDGKQPTAIGPTGGAV